MLSVGKLNWSEAIEEFIYTKMILAVSVFGIAGNVLNLIILSQKSLTYQMERMEKSAHFGLISLAASDLFFCLATLPNVFYGTGRNSGGFAHDSFDFRLVYKLYGTGVINTFMLSSTWLTVTMAVSRYIAICHPLRARQIIGKTFTVVSLMAVFLISVLFNVPRFLRHEPQQAVDGAGRRKYFAHAGPLKRHPTANLAYSWTYFILGIIVPLCVLVFCNAHLIRTLRTTMLSRHESALSFRQAVPRRTARVRSEQATHRITLTLIVIIVLFVALFVPSELLIFFVHLAVQTTYKTEVFNVAVAVGNLLQAINFSVNFVLYSAVNTHFQYMVCRIVGCQRCRSTSRREAILGRNLTAAAAMTAARTDGEMVRHNLRRGRCADSDHVTTALRHHLTPSLKHSQLTASRTIAVSYV